MPKVRCAKSHHNSRSIVLAGLARARTDCTHCIAKITPVRHCRYKRGNSGEGASTFQFIFTSHLYT